VARLSIQEKLRRDVAEYARRLQRAETEMCRAANAMRGIEDHPAFATDSEFAACLRDQLVAIRKKAWASYNEAPAGKARELARWIGADNG
jgi:hypothetical protein